MSIVEYTDFLVKSLVSEPDLVKVDFFDADEDTKILEIIVPEADMKLIIGKNCKNASAIRTLIQAFAFIHKMPKVRINIDAY